jgi:hypothetical protein
MDQSVMRSIREFQSTLNLEEDALSSAAFKSVSNINLMIQLFS